MYQLAFISALTAAVAIVGHSLGVTIHGPGAAALVPAIAGAAGGFGMGCAVLDVVRRWRSSRKVTA